MAILIANRTPESHLAGGAVINRGETGLRFSDDLDIFHDVAANVTASAEADAKALQEAGYAVTWALRKEGFYQADVGRGDDRLKLDWTTDSAFRPFFLPDGGYDWYIPDWPGSLAEGDWTKGAADFRSCSLFS